ncbi:VOC family protein [Acholeplasma laidlawii]|uniref:VOC family protein n=1 Tax=Acholeplasma laidlawii TaxID=2148 RepID=UPI0021F6BBC7|nr:VOC family protein [Acholeplasma laidlawii]
MVNRINIICLGVKDIDASLEFYTKLGFKTTYQKGAPIVFFSNAGTKLELFPIENLILDINESNPPMISKGGFNGITLACNMKSIKEVDDLMMLVTQFGGLVVKHPQATNWGGYSGYFKDLDGYYWEVAYGPMWQFDDNDMLIIE